MKRISTRTDTTPTGWKTETKVRGFGHTFWLIIGFALVAGSIITYPLLLIPTVLILVAAVVIKARAKK